MTFVIALAIFALGIFVGALGEYLRTRGEATVHEGVTGTLHRVECYWGGDGPAKASLSIIEPSDGLMRMPMGPICIHPVTKEKP